MDSPSNHGDRFRWSAGSRRPLSSSPQNPRSPFLLFPKPSSAPASTPPSLHNRRLPAPRRRPNTLAVFLPRPLHLLALPPAPARRADGAPLRPRFLLGRRRPCGEAGSRVQHEAVRGVDGGGAGGAGAPAAAPRLGGAPMVVVAVALLSAPPRLGDFRMQEVVAVAPNRSFFVFRVIRCSLWPSEVVKNAPFGLRTM